MHIFFSVGEPSGDLHAAKLIGELKSRVPELRCSAYGGVQMESAGCEIVYRLTNLAVMGIVDVVPLLWRFVRLLWQAKRWIDDQRPDAVVLVDFPGFNWWIARIAKRRGIPVFYYLPPQLWAWAPWRVRKMRKLVDLVLCCLPFELDWYRRRNVAARYVGHPFFDEVAEKRLDIGFLGRLRPTDADSPIVGILPGSRKMEIERNFAVQVHVMHELHRRHPQVQFLVACLREEHRGACAAWLAQTGLLLPVRFEAGKTSEIIELSDVCLMVSGSVSLEVLARHTPAVVIYCIGRLHRLIGRFVITCRFITLTNLIAGRPVMPEFVMPEFVPSKPIDPSVDEIVETLSRWLGDRTARETKVEEIRRLSAQVAAPGATRHAADAILERLQASPCATSGRRTAA